MQGFLDGALKLALYIGIPLGPAIYTLWRLNHEGQFQADESKKMTVGGVGLALFWTTIMLVTVMYWYSGRGDDLKEVCQAYEADLKARHVSDDRWIYEEEWWYACHPESAPDPPTRD